MLMNAIGINSLKYQQSVGPYWIWVFQSLEALSLQQHGFLTCFGPELMMLSGQPPVLSNAVSAARLAQRDVLCGCWLMKLAKIMWPPFGCHYKLLFFRTGKCDSKDTKQVCTKLKWTSIHFKAFTQQGLVFSFPHIY